MTMEIHKIFWFLVITVGKEISNDRNEYET